ncbi:MAG TPA: MogA/MoaB family molybdenum cofactor biosynthesis protein [candidate division Zixibacteria bacterium]|nr:MogA/MoaB family molybdenum cofactor biosynthesis protein [candidate division Zixibacteria bacterium]
MAYRIGVLIVSDRAARGEREDRCLDQFRKILHDTQFEIEAEALCSDEPAEIRAALGALLQAKPHLLFTCGGTGCAPRDNTPEVSAELIDADVPGIAEAIRRISAELNPNAIYSRAVSGFAGNTLLINLPGSPRAVSEILAFLAPTLDHPLQLRAERLADCADPIDS